MKRVLIGCLAVYLLQMPMAEACTPTVLYGRATAVSDVMTAMLANPNITAGTFINKIEFVGGFIVVYTGPEDKQMCYTYAAGFNGNCSGHGADLWASGPCP
jgi:hypothetical protein